MKKQVITDAHVKRVETIIDRLEKEGQKEIEAGEKLKQSGTALKLEAVEFKMALGRIPKDSPRHETSKQIAPVLSKSKTSVSGSGTVSQDGLAGPERKILNALAWLASIGVNEPETAAVAFLAGYTTGGGAFNNPRGALRGKGFIEYLSGDKLKLTEAGLELADAPTEELTQKKLHEKVLKKLPSPEQKLLKPLLAAYPNTLSNEELAEASGYSNGGGAYNNPRGRLRTLGLVEYRDGRVAARDILFPAALKLGEV